MTFEYRSNRIRGVSQPVQNAAWRLRDEPTNAERILWEALSGRKLDDYKFRRQQPMGRFVLDFYCAGVKLVIELDGSAHTGQAEMDEVRSQQLRSHGCNVIRFSNSEEQRLPAVLAKIGSAAKARAANQQRIASTQNPRDI